MDSLIQFIIGDATTFTPACIVGLIVFCMVLECIGSLAYNILKMGGDQLGISCIISIYSNDIF